MSIVTKVTSASSGIQAAVEEMKKNFKLAPGMVRIAVESEETNSNGGKNPPVWYELDIRHSLTDRLGQRKGSSLPFDDWINCLDEILLKILEELGFSFDGTCTSYNTIGTLYYAVILRKIILFLEATKDDRDVEDKKEALSESLLNKKSQFYLDIAYDFVRRGRLDALHKCIEISLDPDHLSEEETSIQVEKKLDLDVEAKRALEIKEQKLQEKKLRVKYIGDNYMKLAFSIAEFLFFEIESGNIRVESREVKADGLKKRLIDKKISLC